jgi:hypothetical protein
MSCQRGGVNVVTCLIVINKVGGVGPSLRHGHLLRHVIIRGTWWRSQRQSQALSARCWFIATTPKSLSSMSTQPLLQRTAQNRIALPVRVEPKVFFANERSMHTFPCSFQLREHVNNQPYRRTSVSVMAPFHRRAGRPICRPIELWRQGNITSLLATTCQICIHFC